jgi:hypothetical protein
VRTIEESERRRHKEPEAFETGLKGWARSEGVVSIIRFFPAFGLDGAIRSPEFDEL